MLFDVVLCSQKTCRQTQKGTTGARSIACRPSPAHRLAFIVSSCGCYFCMHREMTRYFEILDELVQTDAANFAYRRAALLEAWQGPVLRPRARLVLPAPTSTLMAARSLPRNAGAHRPTQSYARLTSSLLPLLHTFPSESLVGGSGHEHHSVESLADLLFAPSSGSASGVTSGTERSVA